MLCEGLQQRAGVERPAHFSNKTKQRRNVTIQKAIRPLAAKRLKAAFHGPNPRVPWIHLSPVGKVLRLRLGSVLYEEKPHSSPSLRMTDLERESFEEVSIVTDIFMLKLAHHLHLNRRRRAAPLNNLLSTTKAKGPL